MLLGEFERRLCKLNPYLRVIAGSDESKPVGIYFLKDCKEPEHICGVDRGIVSEPIVCEPNGRILRSGWRRAVEAILAAGYARRSKANDVFATRFDRRVVRIVKGRDQEGDLRQVVMFGLRNKFNSEGKPIYTTDDVVDIARELRKFDGNTTEVSGRKTTDKVYFH